MRAEEETHNDLLPEPIIDLSNKCLEHKDTHQEYTQSNTADRNDGNTSSHLDVPLAPIARMDSIYRFSRITIPVPTTPLSQSGGRGQVGNVFRPEPAYCYTLDTSGSPLYGEFTLTDPPVGDKGRRVKSEDEGVDWRVGVFGS
jgi:hypothetical protein